MTFYIQTNQPHTNPARWFVQFFARHFQMSEVKCQLYDVGVGNELASNSLIINDLPLALGFYKKVECGIFDQNNHFKNETLIFTEGGQIDYIATIFYLVNCLQEHSFTAERRDKFGRFPYSESLQKRFGTIQQNLVADLLEKFAESQPILRGLILGENYKKSTRIFLTHDIDTLYGSFVQDGLWAIRRGRFDIVLQLIINELSRKSAYFNIDKILKIHSEYDLKSTFFWLVEQGRSSDGIKNADYKINSRRVQSALKQIHTEGSEIGLHKSSLPIDFSSEFAKLPRAVLVNRYHFLRFQLPEAWQTMSDAGVELDTSLGFAEQYGFRNNYGQPFQPYDLRTGETMPLVVAPLHIMDGTLYDYMKLDPSVIAAEIIDFFEKNKTNCTLSLLWHNTEFSEFQYQPYLAIYKKVLAYIVEAKLPTVTASEILKGFS